MKGAKQHNSRALKKLRRTIESRFSILVDTYSIERNLTRSFIVFWLKIELTVFIYNLDFFCFGEDEIITNYHYAFYISIILEQKSHFFPKTVIIFEKGTAFLYRKEGKK